MKGTTTRTSRTFLYSIHNSFVPAPIPDTLADGKRQLSQKKNVFLFEKCLALKDFLFQRNKINFQKIDVSISILNFDKCGKNRTLFPSVNLEDSQFVSDSPKENFLVYTQFTPNFPVYS